MTRLLTILSLLILTVDSGPAAVDGGTGCLPGSSLVSSEACREADRQASDSSAQVRQRPDSPVQVVRSIQRQVEFDLGPGSDREMFVFSVTTPGSLAVEVQWQGSVGTMDVALANMAAAEATKTTGLILQGPSPLTGEIEAAPDEAGEWGLGIHIADGTAEGTIVITPGTARISQIEEKQAPLPTLSPQAAKVVAVYFHYVERALNGLEETELDQAFGARLAAAPPHVYESYLLGLERYKAIPLDIKIEIGFDADLLERLGDIETPLTDAELRGFGRDLFLPHLEREMESSGTFEQTNVQRHSPFPEINDPPPEDEPPPDPEVDLCGPVWSMHLAWTDLICHDETWASWWEWMGSDEPVAIFAMFESTRTTRVNIDAALAILEADEDDAARDAWWALQLKLKAPGPGPVDIADIQPGGSDELDEYAARVACKIDQALKNAELAVDMPVTNHWVRRTPHFGDVDDGSHRSGYIQLTPEEFTRSWFPLTEIFGELSDEWLPLAILADGTVVLGEEPSRVLTYSVPVQIVVAMAFETEGWLDELMDTVESQMADLTDLAEALTEDGEPGGLPRAPYWHFYIPVIAHICVIWDLTMTAIEPEFLGSEAMVFTPRGYQIGQPSEDAEDGYEHDSDPCENPTEFADASGLIPLTPGRTSLELRGMFTGDNSDYELDFELTFRKSELACRDFDPEGVRLTLLNIGFFQRWLLVDAFFRPIAQFDDEDEARLALSIVQHYGLSRHCQLGSPEPAIEYWLADGYAPVGAFDGEDCWSFDPEALEVKEVDGLWVIAYNAAWLLGCGEREDEARAALSIIQTYGFDHICWVGRPEPSMVYFRK